MKHRTTIAALAAIALTLGAGPATAAPADRDDGNAEIRVLNNHLTQVRVFVEDGTGKLHNVGRVARGQYKVLDVDASITARGPVRVKFFPADPSWSPMADDSGIRTRDIDLRDGGTLTAFLEAELTASVIEVEAG